MINGHQKLLREELLWKMKFVFFLILFDEIKTKNINDNKQKQCCFPRIISRECDKEINYIQIYKDCPFVTNNTITIKESTCRKLDETQICKIHWKDFASSFICKRQIKEPDFQNDLIFFRLLDMLYIAGLNLLIIIFINMSDEFYPNKSLSDIFLCCKKKYHHLSDEEIEMNNEEGFVLTKD